MPLSARRQAEGGPQWWVYAGILFDAGISIINLVFHSRRSVRSAGRRGVKRFISQEPIMNLVDFVKDACRQIDPTAETLQQVAARFEAAVRGGLAKQPSSLPMLPSFIDRPTGAERGEAVAIDFGGTNVRILKVGLNGGQVQSGRPHMVCLKDPGGAYDYTLVQTQAEELFDFIARHVKEMLGGDDSELPLGHTFSFPCRQEGINSAVLLFWTKEIRTSGVVGRDVTTLLVEALRRQGVRNVRPRAIINDTVGTLLAAAYKLRGVEVGSICGTGHNTCYLEPKHPLTGMPMIVNMEAGSFDGVRLTYFDQEVNEASVRPGGQLLEKMVSGAYLGEVVLAAMRTMVTERVLPIGNHSWDRGALTGFHLSQVLSDGPGCDNTRSVAENRLALRGLSDEQLQAIRKLVGSVTGRSARLVGATYAGILRYLDPGLEREHVIAVDGSLYEKMPGYQVGIRSGLEAVLGPGARGVVTRLVKDGSGIGAAIAALVAEANPT
jgi:hexokinase